MHYRTTGTSDLQQQQDAAGAQHPQKLLESGSAIRDMPQGITHADEVDTGFGYRQLFSLRPYQRDPQCALGFRQHVLADIEPDHIGTTFCDLQSGACHESGADGDVEHAHTRTEAAATQGTTAVPSAGPKRE